MGLVEMAEAHVFLDKGHISILRYAASSQDGTVHSEGLSEMFDYLESVFYIKNLGGGIYKITPSGIKTLETFEIGRVMDIDFE